MSLPHITIYTDGGCDPNPGPGGWGAILIQDDGTEIELSDGAESTTNNRMEMSAVITALNHLTKGHRVDLYVDSQYVKNGITQWIAGWQRKNWQTSTGNPVKNQDLWQTLDSAVKRHEITWHWVKGHAGDQYNERVDELATTARPGEKGATNTTVELGDNALTVFIRVAVPKNDKAGGWALRIWDGQTATDHSGRIPQVSSANAMEIMAAFQIFKTVPKDATLRIYCPGDYLHKGITQWIHGWKKKNWRTASGSAVKNADAWRALDEAQQGRTVDWVWEDRKKSPAIAEGLDKVAQQALQS